LNHTFHATVGEKVRKKNASEVRFLQRVRNFLFRCTWRRSTSNAFFFLALSPKQFSFSLFLPSVCAKYVLIPLSFLFQEAPFVLERGEEEEHDGARRCVSSFGCAISFSGAQWRKSTSDAFFFLTLSPTIACVVWFKHPFIPSSIVTFPDGRRRLKGRMRCQGVFPPFCGHGGNAPPKQFSFSLFLPSVGAKCVLIPLFFLFQKVPFMLERGEEEEHDGAWRYVSSFGVQFPFQVRTWRKCTSTSFFFLYYSQFLFALIFK
jgi:hypothetical protein